MGLTESVADSACKFEIWFRKRKKNDIFVLQVCGNGGGYSHIVLWVVVGVVDRE